MAALLLPQPPIPRGTGAAACGGVPEGGALEPGPLGAAACRWPFRGSPGGPSGPRVTASFQTPCPVQKHT